MKVTISHPYHGVGHLTTRVQVRTLVHVDGSDMPTEERQSPTAANFWYLAPDQTRLGATASSRHFLSQQNLPDESAASRT